MNIKVVFFMSVFLRVFFSDYNIAVIVIYSIQGSKFGCNISRIRSLPVI